MSTETLSAPRGVAPAAAPSGAARSAGYWRFWRAVPRELGYLLPTFLIAWIVSQALIAGFSAAAGLLFVAVGVVLIPIVLLGGRYAGRFEVARLSFTRLPRLGEPVRRPPFAGKGFWRALVDIAANPHDWLAYVHGALIAPIVATVTFVVWTVWTSVTLSLLAAPILLTIRPFLPGTRYAFEGTGGSIAANGVDVSDWSLADLFAYGFARDDSGVATGWIVAVSFLVGVILLALYPFVSRGLVWAHWGAARLLLTRFPSEQLEEAVASLSESRRAAVVAEDHALRRLERDIHDGPQQRLLRLQLDLASAERRLADDPASARELLASARLLTKDTLDELRALTQGFAPPILQDRGLAAALESLGGRSVIPVTTAIDLRGTVVPSEIERGAYFVAAELVSNAVKHAGASSIQLSATVSPQGDAERMLTVRVEDDGRGGALLIPGHGLAGLSERLLGLRGTLLLDSASGGPTVATAMIPLGSDAAADPAPTD